MALNQKLLKEKLDAYAKIEAKISKLTKKRNAELDPFIAEHNEKTAPIINKYNGEIFPLNAQSGALAGEIQTLLKANTDAQGNPKLITVTSEKAQAAVSKSAGSRVVKVQEFFDAFKIKTTAFWQCVTVQVAKAEQLLGKDKVDEISDKKTSYSVSISLKK